MTGLVPPPWTVTLGKSGDLLQSVQLLKVQFQANNWELVRVCGTVKLSGFPLPQSPHLRVCVITCILARAALFTGVLGWPSFRTTCGETALRIGLQGEERNAEHLEGKWKKYIKPMASLSVAITLTMKWQPVISQATPMWRAGAKFANWGVKRWEGRVKHQQQNAGHFHPRDQG